MSLHIGEKIKERAAELRVGTTELAAMINTSKQNIYGIFKRESIDTALLEKFSRVLKYDFFVFYINPKLIKDSEDLLKKKLKLYKSQEEEENIQTLKSQLADIKEKYDLLKKVNHLLEEKKGKRV